MSDAPLPPGVTPVVVPVPEQKADDTPKDGVDTTAQIQALVQQVKQLTELHTNQTATLKQLMEKNTNLEAEIIKARDEATKAVPSSEAELIVKQRNDLVAKTNLLEQTVNQLLEENKAKEKQFATEKERSTIRDKVLQYMQKKRMQAGEIEKIESYVDQFRILDGIIVSNSNLANGVEAHFDELLKAYPYLQEPSKSGDVRGNTGGIPSAAKVEQMTDKEIFDGWMTSLINDGIWSAPYKTSV